MADAVPGKGPVRGYPPAPGQPPPLYPPGQFAAWNKRRDGTPDGATPWAEQGGIAETADPVDHARRPAAPAGPPADPAGPLTGRSGQRRGPGQRGRHSQPPRRPQPGGTSLSRYYTEGTDGGPEPGYPVLAVSDPAADVTTTQTWRAIAEGRSTGIWAAPAGLRGAAGSAPAGRSAAGTDNGPPTALRSGPHTSPQAAPRSGPHTSPRTATRSGPNGTVRPTRSPSRTGPQATPGTDGTAHQAGTRTASRRRRPLSVQLSMAAALVLVLAAAGSLGYFVVHKLGNHPKPVAESNRTRPSASPSPSLGPYGHIETRQTDPQPLTIAQLYPASYTDTGATVTATANNLSTNCLGAITGANLQVAVSSAGCSQVARATYFSSLGMMGTIGVFNLATAAKATTAVQSTDANNYVTPVAGTKGATLKVGQGTGIEWAAAKGHYLILIWAELSDLAKPTATQTTALENFMTGLLRNTANVSLSNRLLTGAP